jgi:hypothetical protein
MKTNSNIAASCFGVNREGHQPINTGAIIIFY